MLTRWVSLQLFLIAAAASALGAEIVGWRGDGTGSFPGTSTPVRWSKVSKPMADLRCQAERPAGAAASGTPAYWGALTEWQVLGPLPSVGGDGAIDEDFGVNEAAWQPSPAEAVKGARWRKVTLEGNTIDFSAIFGQEREGAQFLKHLDRWMDTKPYTAYAHTYVYSPADARLQFSFGCTRQAKVCVNGEFVSDGKKAAVVTLRAGWNRVLCKSTNQPLEKDPGPWTMCPYPSYWHLDVGLVSAWPYEWETSGFRWATPMPSWSSAHPLVVGERIFVLSEPNELVCVNKVDGRMLWRRAIVHAHSLSQEDLAANAALEEAVLLAAKLDGLEAAPLGTGGMAEGVEKERAELIKQIDSVMRKADREKYGVRGSHGNCLATPVSDGRRVYVWLPNISLAACYELDGRRVWCTMLHPSRNQEHGVHSSPTLAGGRMVIFKIDLVGLDAATGRVVWRVDLDKGRMKYGDMTHASPVRVAAAGREFVYIYGSIIDAAGGAVVFEEKGSQTGQQIATPVVLGGLLFECASSGRLRRSAFSAGTGGLALGGAADIQLLPRVGGAYTRGFVCSSTLHHQGLVYAVDCMGELHVVDASTMKLVYKKKLGTGFESKSKVHSMGTCYASPVLAGGNIYVFGMTGTTIVLRPGRQYQELARNKIEDVFNPTHWSAAPEGFSSTPVADGKCLYIRGDKYLYCVGER